MEDFPGNSHTSRMTEKKDQAQEPEKSKTTSGTKKVEKVVTGRVTQREKKVGARLKDMFIQDGGNFGAFLVEKVIVPMAKDMILSVIEQTANGFRQGLEEKLFGPDENGRRSRTTSYGASRAPVNYTRYSTSSSTIRRGDTSTRPSYHRSPSAVRRSNNVKEFIVETREDGDLVLEELDAVIETVGHCTVGDFYSTMGENTTSTDEGWGWTDLSGARVSKLSADEYLITMPRPRPIEG